MPSLPPHYRRLPWPEVGDGPANKVVVLYLGTLTWSIRVERAESLPDQSRA